MQSVTYFDRGEACAMGTHLFALRSKLPLIDESADTVWIHCARPGEWKGHQAGEFEFNRKVFSRIIDNFKRLRNPIPLTYEHPEHRGDDGIAAGWVHELKVNDDGLWALCELTQKAAGHVKSGEYRFCSVVVDFEAIDPESGDDIGPELMEIGLTNVPFIDGLSAIRLSRRAAGVRRLSMNIKDILKEAAKDLPDDATPEQLMKYVEGAMAKAEATEGDDKPKDKPEAPEASQAEASETQETNERKATEESAESVQLAEDGMADQAVAALEGLASELGIDTAQVLALLQERHDDIVGVLSGGNEGEASPMSRGNEATEAAMSRITALQKESKAKDTQIAELSKRIDELHSKECEREVDADIEKGLFHDKQRAALVKLRRESPEIYAEFRGQAEEEPAVPVGKKVQSSAPASKAGPDDGSDLSKEEIETYELAFGFIKDPEKRRAKAIQACRDFKERASARS